MGELVVVEDTIPAVVEADSDGDGFVKYAPGEVCDLRGVGCWLCVPVIEARSESGLLGSLMPPSRGGDCEVSRERGKVCWMGELNEVGGADPDE